MSKPQAPRPNLDRILIARYSGSYGDTVRIDLQTLESLSRFADLLRTFCFGTEIEKSVSGLRESVFEAPLADLTFCKSRPTAITSTRVEGKGTVIVWNQPPDAWKETLGLVEGLEQAALQGKSGHQYLTESERGILVEMAFKE